MLLLKQVFSGLKFKYSIIFSFPLKKTGYVALKCFLLMLFFIPHFIYSIYDDIVEFILLPFVYIPIIGLIFRFICYILGSINSIFFTILCFADIAYSSPNMDLIEEMNSQGMLK